MKKIGVNGFGRIGRYFTRMSLKQSDVSVAVVNDLADIKTLAHLLKYDSVHRQIDESFKVVDDAIVFDNGNKIIFTQYSDPAEIPWSDFDIDIVLESTGLFRTEEDASKHFKGGAKKVIISAPGQGENIKSVVLGVNDEVLTADDKLISNASCTTNSAAPMVKLISKLCQIDSAYITTVHSYTSDQRLHDAPHKDLRRARAAAESIVPTTTGAAKALTKIFPELDGHIGGCGIRVPVPDGSLTDLTLTIAGNVPTLDEINAEFKRASEQEMKGILSYIDEPLVSSDIIGNSHSCVFDSQLTSVVGNLVKLVGWYDNEAGYSNRLIDLIKAI
ncbi:type I glyceraldehyde-3-phosphate dehydrogenase [Brumimicrobium aurantiacum]|uniref:Type I glyceraldehyde-3-phosphate dehydrogenase n=1 Tax=Brumimicrobium aurantiacum TaxID=1737063 RepID=A0A3E1F0P8_9FLAO|nr:type I glyceraldehyde-3-phosphate dehydrogenase [Brumimicrobium aurantiacum]RFC55386.1 type I glyceraldehyde-3-phosphate dehydrogenase [Brumimicrobium aurantiacum]